jgi:hypothetical protein
MNFNRGFRQSDSTVIARRDSQSAPQAIIHSDEQNRSRCVLHVGTQKLKAPRVVSMQFFPFRSLSCCWLLSASSPALGQSTFGSVRGVVQDASGAAVSDTKIVLHSTVRTRSVL